MDQGAQGLEVIWSVYAGRREALHRSAGLSEALHARVQSLRRLCLRLWNTSLVSKEVFESLRPSLSPRSIAAETVPF